MPNDSFEAKVLGDISTVITAADLIAEPPVEQPAATVQKTLTEQLTDLAKYAIKRFEQEHNTFFMRKRAEVAQYDHDTKGKLDILDQKISQIEAAREELLARAEQFRVKASAEIEASESRKKTLCAAQRSTLSALHVAGAEV